MPIRTRHGQSDHAHSERSRTAPIKIVHELKDGDGGTVGTRRKEKDDDRECSYDAYKGRNYSRKNRPAQHWRQDIAKTAQTARAETRRRFVD